MDVGAKKYTDMIEHIHGARWWKFDFHNHTPKSTDYGKGDVSEKNISCEDWLLEFMKKEIDCIAVTDHNTGAWIDDLKKAYEGMKEKKAEGFRELYIFPGVEISVNGGIHLLAILDLNATGEDIANLIGNCNYQGDSGDSNGVTTESLESVIELIVKRGGIAIPAHVDKSAGLFDKLSGPSLKQALNNNRDNLLAIELIEKSFTLPDTYNQSKLSLAKIVGSDSHTRSEIGRNYTWVKMSTPSLDALKLALHDGEDGVIRKEDAPYAPNQITNKYFIKSILVSNGYKSGNGSPLCAEFSPWLSSVIGGRGSGKSTIVNYLRIAFDRIDEMPTEIQEEFNNFNRIGKKNSSGMLRDNTKIVVELFKDGQLQRIKWENKVHSLQTWDDDTSDWSEDTIVSNINELFPIQIFSQKELYALTGDPSKLIELIDSQFDKQAWIELRNDLVKKWLADRATARELRVAISDEKNLKAQLEATKNKIKLYESSEYKETLDKFNKFSAANKFFVNTEKSFSDWLQELNETQKSIPTIQIPESCSDVIKDESSAFVQQLNDVLKSANDKISEALSALSPYKPNLLNQINDLPWHKEYLEAKTAYSEIVDKIEELGSESYEILIQRQGALSDKLTSLAAQKQRLETINQSLEETYNSIIEKEKELRIKRREIIDRWKDVDTAENPFLIIELLPMGDAELANSSFRKFLRKEGTEFSSYIYNYDEESDSASGLIADIIGEPESSRWDKRKEQVNNFASVSELDAKGFDIRLARHIDWLYQNTPEDIDRLLIWVPEDKLVLKFKKQGKEEDIQTGSAGERTAGMLGLLLALNEIPLIIDQPEDDLDTRLISSFVVPGFKSLKRRRQLLLVTHNPNIAINANSDNIVYMNFQTGQIIVAGNDALQDRSIRSAVCDVMEGGADALNKRYYRISKALN